MNYKLNIIMYSLVILVIMAFFTEFGIINGLINTVIYLIFILCIEKLQE